MQNSDEFISKFAYGSYTPEIDEDEEGYQSFNGETEFLNGFKVLWEDVVKKYTAICDPSYIGTDDYYE